LHPEDKIQFELLKNKIVGIMQQTYPGINPSIAQWRGQEITDFQEELLAKVNAHISEKWFYTHMKADGSSLPRIDVLNLLSKYAGYANWDEFRFRNQGKTGKTLPPKQGNRYFVWVPLITLVVVLALYAMFRLTSTREYRFCFYDADTREPVSAGRVEVSLLIPGESPAGYLSSPDGCLSLKTGQSDIRMVVRNPYYKTDTVTRTLRRFNPDETIFLHANDYALMLHYFSRMSVKDWEKRRSQLDLMFDEGALIMQVHGGLRGQGMELYNKREFIDKLTVPSATLRQIEVLDTKYRGGKIILLRFRVNEMKDE
jgi:hypothetical protein